MCDRRRDPVRRSQLEPSMYGELTQRPGHLHMAQVAEPFELELGIEMAAVQIAWSVALLSLSPGAPQHLSRPREAVDPTHEAPGPIRALATGLFRQSFMDQAMQAAAHCLLTPTVCGAVETAPPLDLLNGLRPFSERQENPTLGRAQIIQLKPGTVTPGSHVGFQGAGWRQRHGLQASRSTRADRRR